ncbi:MAG: tRNA lysidine(34) synthetase TilS [Candidatus Brocadiia bacterium]
MDKVLTRLEIKVWRNLKKFGHLFGKETPVIVAVSGGPDSVALLRLIMSVWVRHKVAAPVHVAHFDHAMRGVESDGDAAFVKSLAGEFGIPFHYQRLGNEGMAKGRGIEDNLRRARYRFLFSVASQIGARAILLGHTFDDNVETVLMRFLRGANLNGLAGIKPARAISVEAGSRRIPVYVLRPMLEISKAEILEYVVEGKFDYRKDSSNDDNALRRNWVRNSLLPSIREKFNPGIDKVISQLSHQMLTLDSYLSEVLVTNYPIVVSERGTAHASLKIGELRKRHPAIAQEILSRLLGQLSIRGANDYRHIQAIFSLVYSERPEAQCMLPDGFMAVRRGLLLEIMHRAEWEKNNVEEKKRKEIDTRKEVVIPVPGSIAVPGVGSIRTQVLPFHDDFMDKFVEQKTNLEEFVDSDKIVLPIVFRYPRPEDTFWPLGQQKPRRLASFLRDAKIPLHMRDKVPVIADAEKVIWVVKWRVSEAVKFEKGGKTMKTIRISLKEL